MEKFDCIYYISDNGEEIPYCQRLEGNEDLNRTRTMCENEGEKISFRQLIDRRVELSEVLNWSSSVEINDLYVRVFYNHSTVEDNSDQFVCYCKKSGTFGKYCEYQLTHDESVFSDALNAQFNTKHDNDSWNTQRYGKIICYETLPCNTSDLCFDWREICDGIQRCTSGIDEENWHKLEFNECEDDEFRCTNGMCITEEFWLDGDFDCMDWSDERYNIDSPCSFYPNPMDCDEHLCHPNMYSCGDGQCISWKARIAFQRIMPSEDDCFNKRNLNFMCEVNRDRQAWTLESGLCWLDKNYNDSRYPAWDMINTSNLSDEEKCQYLVRCLFPYGFERDCPCNRANCTQMLRNVCTENENRVVYPPDGLINANIFFYYENSDSTDNTHVNVFAFGGNIKCRGFHFTSYVDWEIPPSFLPVAGPHASIFLCDDQRLPYGHRNMTSPFQYDQFCWNESFAFNGRPYAVHPDACPVGRECISQYRIHDGFENCLYNEDELVAYGNSFCTEHVGRHRFQCFKNESKCLPLLMFGTETSECSNNYDEMWYGLGFPLEESRECHKSDHSDCNRLKDYIRQSSIANFTQNNSLVDIRTRRIPFQSYCDSFWNLNSRMDESPSSCQHWKCQNHQYQCQTGQCIELTWVCDGEWDCADSSDEDAIILIRKWSSHNNRLVNLNKQLERCHERYPALPFSNICNTSFEFGCFLAGVSNPLDIKSNRPCINLTQIGDGTNQTIREIDSWRYRIYFDYLPSFRLAVVLKFPSWFENKTLESCQRGSCNENSSCLPIFNQNQSHYCSCKSGYYGKECNIYESRCETYYSTDAFCRPDYDFVRSNNTKIDCICPLDHFGPRCHLKYDDCKSDPCLNNGTCLLTHDRSGETSYICTCSERFYGERCDIEKETVR
ncbi:unnamed protein product, partial [Didymodactylos carnosus]